IYNFLFLVGTKLRKGIVPYSNETLGSRDPDPCLRYVHPPYQFPSALPPQMSYEEQKAASAAIKANLAASIAAIEARSAIAIAAARTEGQAEAGGPVLKRAR
nr:hypothetical protein [Tanacetum cinerariifolium]